MTKLKIARIDRIVNVEINNPPVNVLTIDLINEVNEFVLSLKDDSDTAVVIFRSSNTQFFSAHLDLNVINGSQGGASCMHWV